MRLTCIRPSQAVKRAVDLCVAAAALVALAPFLFLVWFCVLATSGTPVLFRQARPGRDGQLFTLYKFRTMRPPREEEVWFRSDAARLTRVGRLLRVSSVDEIPELWNVLKGDMSLVGPRPLLAEYLPRYTPEQLRRHEVRPGITGWAQINGRQNIPFSKRLALDVWYVDHWSLWLDFKIVVATLGQLVTRRGVVPGQNVDEVDDLSLSTEVRRPRSER